MRDAGPPPGQQETTVTKPLYVYKLCKIIEHSRSVYSDTPFESDLSALPVSSDLNAQANSLARVNRANSNL
jgi:hypothetical protein